MSHTGFDTETERGHAVLLCTPTSSLFFPVDFDEAASWLADFREEKRGPRPTFIAWNVSYDAQALLRLLPMKDAAERDEMVRLGLTTRATFGRWRVRFIPHKLFEASAGRAEGFAIFDGLPFFGMGLDAAARKVLGDRGKEKLPAGAMRYLKRGLVGTAIRKGYRDVIETYCKRDALLAQRLGEKLADSCAAAGLDFSRPVSPASLARRRWGSKMAGSFGAEDEEFARPAFRGGRIEVLARGMISHARRWDLHSAYPSVMAGFFSPRACGRVEGEKLRDDAAYAIADVWLDLNPGFPSYPVAVKLPEGLVYPWGVFDARLDLHTLRAVLAAPRGMVRKLTIRRLVQWVPVSDERPFAEMAPLYVRRTTDPGASLALKLMLNASYGLLAEHVPMWLEADDPSDATFLGGRWWRHIEKAGSGQSYVLASHVTGAIRARVWLDTLDAEPFAFMTDGVLCAGRPSGAHGPELGAWGSEGEGRALIVGSGLYGVEDADELTLEDGTRVVWSRWKTKTRGWRRLPPLPELLAAAGARSVLDLSDKRALSVRQLAISPRAAWDRLNELRDLPRRLDLNFDRKREWGRRLRARDFLDRMWTSRARGVIGEGDVS